MEIDSFASFPKSKQRERHDFVTHAMPVDVWCFTFFLFIRAGTQSFEQQVMSLHLSPPGCPRHDSRNHVFFFFDTVHVHATCSRSRQRSICRHDRRIWSVKFWHLCPNRTLLCVLWRGRSAALLKHEMQFVVCQMKRFRYLERDQVKFSPNSCNATTLPDLPNRFAPLHPVWTRFRAVCRVWPTRSSW